MKRLGTVLVFKDGTTEEEAAEALRKIEEVLDIKDYFLMRRPDEDKFERLVHEFDDDWGGPVWYIP